MFEKILAGIFSIILIAIVLVFIIALILPSIFLIFLTPILFWVLFNYIAPIFHLLPISFVQALVIVVLLSLAASIFKR